MTANRRPMTLMVITNDAERIHMALMTGATAAAVGRPVTYFFSKSGVQFLQTGAWETLLSPGGITAPEMDAALLEKGIADSDMLIDGLSALDVRFVACETALAEQGVDVSTLVQRPAVEISGLADILEKGAGGDFLTF
ncbi:DsrE family protein [Kordiimonas aquimaris]|uniref:DsrE family protein n=1 Tax=Kordiimonas aquimaris TaxID=707591 RepID=UPI0021D3B03A|nr:DsrE family protein [Kordiimonas aquimaris]